MARRTCKVSDYKCEAPAGWGTAAGWAPGYVSAKLTCYVCGEPVCKACSHLVKWHGHQVRACVECAPEEEQQNA